MQHSEKTEAIREKIKHSLILLGKICFPKAFTQRTPDVHREWQTALLDDAIERLNIIAPRGLAKTTLVAILKSLHHLMYGEGQKVIVVVSRTQQHAINVVQSIKDILEYSLEFRAIFGYWGQHTARQWSNHLVILQDGSAIAAKGMGQMIRGWNIGGQRPTLFILDDPEDENNTKTTEAMDSNFRWLVQSADPSKDAKKGRIITIGTPLHQKCLVLTLKEMANWKTLHYSCLKDKSGYVFQLDGRDWESMSSIWPEMFSVDDLKNMYESLESIGKASSFYKERLCWVTGDEEQLFKEEYLRYYEPVNI